MNGKVTCSILRMIRQDVARMNEVDYTPIECHHSGNCNGTCPLCEEELRYIENKLAQKEALGYDIKYNIEDFDLFVKDQIPQ